jgi:hypothetical protein
MASVHEDRLAAESGEARRGSAATLWARTGVVDDWAGRARCRSDSVEEDMDENDVFEKRRQTGR